jgi:hypothetical protein
MAPSRAGYYAMRAGDPAVYLVPSYPGERLYLTPGSVRGKKLPAFPVSTDVSRFTLESAKSRFVLETRDGGHEFIMTAPYKVPRKVDMERFEALMTFFKELRIRDFEDDNPASLAVYGLDKPVKVFIEGPEASLRLLAGRADGSKQYAKLEDKPGVFSLNQMEAALAAKAFELVDTRVYSPAPDTVDSIAVSGGGKTLTVEIRRAGETNYFFNGRRVSPASFSAFFEACAGLVMDAENPSPSARPPAPEMSIRYTLNTPPGAEETIGLAPYNRDFYALVYGGVSEFLMARRELQPLLDAAEKMEFIE